jgi:hypothetical protein
MEPQTGGGPACWIGFVLKEFLLTNRNKSTILKSKTKRREFMVR